MLVEDGPDNQRLISFHLRKAGAHVTIADNGVEAMKLITEDESVDGELKSAFPFDLVLTDMQMPEMDGYELTRLLRQKGHRGPVIALTAHAMGGDRERCLGIGCDDYATKPIDREALIQTIVDQISGNATRHAA